MGWDVDTYDSFGTKWILASKEELFVHPLYKDYILLDTPQNFSELFKDQFFQIVEPVSIFKMVNDGKEKYSGFCGQFEWKDNKIVSLDGDSYNPDMTVYGYMEFENHEAYVYKGLSVLVGSDW